MSIELQPPRGMRDFLPTQMILRKKAMESIERVFRSFGFDPLETPAVEKASLLRSKAGDVEKQIFCFEGGELGLRFDLTVPFARVVAGNPEIPKPFKRYSISRVWRKEEPQRGRFREFWQADVDIAGSAGMACEAELLACACRALEALGFSEFKILLNNRKILEKAIAAQGFQEKDFAPLTRSIDKLEKIGENGVVEELEGKGFDGGNARRLIASLKASGSNQEKLSAMAGTASEGVRELEEILSLAQAYGISEKIAVDFTLARGLDYYTGPIFEIQAGGGVGSVSGGGRYDRLIQSYGGAPTPAVGISLGVERLMELLAKGGAKTLARVFIAAVKPDFQQAAIQAASRFRAAGIAAQTDLMQRNLKKQLDYASAMGIPFAAIIGEREAKEGKVMLKDLRKGVENPVLLEDAVKAVSEDEGC